MFTVSIETVKSKTQPCSSVEKIFFLMQEDMNMKRNFGHIEILRKKNERGASVETTDGVLNLKGRRHIGMQD